MFTPTAIWYKHAKTLINAESYNNKCTKHHKRITVFFCTIHWVHLNIYKQYKI